MNQQPNIEVVRDQIVTARNKVTPFTDNAFERWVYGPNFSDGPIDVSGFRKLLLDLDSEIEELTTEHVAMLQDFGVFTHFTAWLLWRLDQASSLYRNSWEKALFRRRR